MNSKNTKFLIATLVVVNFCSSLALAQPQAKEGHSLVGGIAEPLGGEYEAPKKLNADVSRITAYRPAVGFGVGVATMEVNGHYHTSLQLGSYTQICLKPTKPATLESRLVETGVPVKSEVDIKTAVLLKQGQDLFVRLSDQGNGRASIEVVSSETAASELKATRLQAHAVSRVPEAVSCDAIVNESQQVASTAIQSPKKVESITLASDALFGFGKSDAQAIPAAGRASLDRLIERLLKQYGTFENTQVQVIGYADPLGNPASNQRLSEERAQAIKGYMVEGGIASTKISSEGRGASDFIVTKCASTATPASIECNKPNRRVVVTVLVTEPR
jgi:OOP family OmpA-OmpF porin